MSALNVMFVNGSLFGGGAEQVISTTARHLRAAGHRVVIAIVHHGLEIKERLRQDGFDVITQLASGRGRFASPSRLRQLIAGHNIDVVHSHDLRSLIDVGLCRLGNRRIAHVHTFHFGNYPFVSRRHLLMEAAFARVPDQLVAVGNAQRDSIVKALHLRTNSIRTVWNGVDLQPRSHRAARDGRRVRIGSVSTLGEQKGIPTLLQSARLLRDRGFDFELVIVGEGPLRPSLERMALDLGLAECVTFTGWRHDAPTLLPTFDVFVQSSYWEAMSMVILEAMAARCAIVATRVGENESVLSHGDFGILVPARNPEALADGLARAIADPVLRERLGAAGHAAYLKQFTGKAMADRYAEVYRECALERRRTMLGDPRAQAAIPSGGHPK